MSNIAIKIENLSKCYQIYDHPQDRLKQMLSRGRKKYYKEFWALKEVSFEVKKGETIGIIGRNGSGKSTLLQMICGTLNPTSGSLQTHGRIAALLELGSGFNPEFTGRENVYLNASVLGLTSAEIEARFAAIEAFADIGMFIDQPVKTYSSGMMVRLAFAVIAYVNADILVIDEALAVGDVFFTQKCMRFLREFVENGTLIFVTHDTASVMSFCSSAIWLEKGKARLISSAKRVCEAYLEDMHNIAADSVEPTISQIKVVNRNKLDFEDMRQQFVNQSNLRNDIQIAKFSVHSNSFGTNLVEILDVYLSAFDGSPMAWIVGGELVTLTIKANCKSALSQVIVGFIVRDKLGQNLFGDNTFISYPTHKTNKGELIAQFSFRMPILPASEYTVSVAVADGTQNDHDMHIWQHDALVFSSHSSSLSTGLIGIPMLQISLR